MNQSKQDVTKGIRRELKMFTGQDKSEFPHWIGQMDRLWANCDGNEWTMWEDLLSKTTGRAHTFIKSMKNQEFTWAAARKELVKYFDPVGGREGAMSKLLAIQQGVNQTTADYNLEVLEICQELDWATNICHVIQNHQYVKGLKADALRRKFHPWTSHKTLDEIMDAALQCEKSDAFARRGAVAAPVMVNAVSSGTVDNNVMGPGPASVTGTSEVLAVGPPIARNGQGGRKWCEIHESTGHSLAECKEKDATECRHCREAVAPGGMAAHAGKCQKGRCFVCNKRGHQQDNCFQRNRGGGERVERGTFRRRERSTSRDRRDRRRRSSSRDRRDRRHRSSERSSHKRRHEGRDKKEGTTKKAKVNHVEASSGSESDGQ